MILYRLHSDIWVFRCCRKPKKSFLTKPAIGRSVLQGSIELDFYRRQSPLLYFADEMRKRLVLGLPGGGFELQHPHRCNTAVGNIFILLYISDAFNRLLGLSLFSLL